MQTKFQVQVSNGQIQLPPGVAVAWQPQPRQAALITCPVYDILFGGARGGGKTDALLGDFAFHAAIYGQYAKGILFRKTMPEFEEIIARSKEIYGRLGWSWQDQKKTWTAPNGATIKLRYLKKESDFENYMGHSYTWVGVDEIGNFASPHYIDKMRATLRSPHGVPISFRASCNPGGRGHNWLKMRYVDPAPPMRPFYDPAIKDYRVFIPSKIQDNEILMRNDPGYINRVRDAAGTPWLEKAWMDGDWNIVAGGMLDDLWRDNIHKISYFPPKRIPKGWRIDRSYDHGQSKPFSVGWWCESNGEPLELPDGRKVGQIKGDIIRFAEWYNWTGKPNEGRRMFAKAIAEGILERERNMEIAGRVKAGPADTNIFDDYEPDKSVANDMLLAGVKWQPADKGPGSRKQGAQQIRKYLQGAIPQSNGYRENPGLFVFETCTQWLRTTPCIPRDEKDPDDVDTDVEDHPYDDTRYRLRYKPKSVQQSDF